MRNESDRQSLGSFLDAARANLASDLARHRARPFPPGIEKGERVGFIEPVMADADLYGWALRVAGGSALTDTDLEGLAALRNDVVSSLDVLEREARSYFGDLADTATRAHVIEWLRKVGQRFVELRGRSVVEWSGIEMALRVEGEDGRPQFEDPAVPFFQFLSLNLDLDSGTWRVTCSQHDDIFGLYVERAAKSADVFEGIYRWGEGFDAPVGVIDVVDVTVEEGVIAEVELTIAGRRVLLMAGEVEEGPGPSIKMRRFDESVLLFPDSADVAILPWFPPRCRQRASVAGSRSENGHDWTREIWLVIVAQDVDPAEVRRHWNVKETPLLDAVTSTAPSLRLGTSEVPLPDNDGKRGPVGRIVDFLFLVGTTPEYVLPLIDDELIVTLLGLLERQPTDPPFDVVGAEAFEEFLREHSGARLVFRG